MDTKTKNKYENNRKICRDIELAFRAGRKYPNARYFVHSGSLLFGIPKKYTGDGFSYLGLTVAESCFGEGDGELFLRKIAKRLNAQSRAAVAKASS